MIAVVEKNGVGEREKQIVRFALGLLPRGIRGEVVRIAEKRRDFPLGLSEIRVRARSRSSVVISGENIPLFTRLEERELAALLDRVLGGSLYAHEKELSEGYVTLPHGIRVGICAHTHREGFRFASSMIFRLPLGICSCSEELFSLWAGGEGGMLIYSLPCGGKTTAIRALSHLISKRQNKRVVIVDERGEFDPEEYLDTTVDILRGFSKERGTEIAQRTLGAEVIAIDEIGNSAECEALMRVGRGGVPMLATAHADSLCELMEKSAVRPLISAGYFTRFVRLFRRGAGFAYEINE